MLGVNYYHGDAVSGRPDGSPTDHHGGPANGAESAFPSAEHVTFPRRGLPRTAMGWEVQPDGLRRLLVRLRDDYAVPPMYVTETGAAYVDELVDGAVHDPERVAFLESYLGAVRDAIDDGVDVRGVFWWSLLDNFEWAYGYAKRFGLVHVDYETQARTVKSSGLRYAEIAATWGLPSPRRRPTSVTTVNQPTLDEVARLAGVSRATASRAINGGQRVSSSAQAAVDEAVRSLGYVPNQAARSLVTRRTDSVAVVVPEPDDRVFSDPFFAGTLRGVNRALAQRDLQLVLLLAQPGAEKARTLRYLSHHHVDGAVVVSHHRDDGLANHLTALGLPSVFVGRPLAGADRVTYVDVDNVAGAREATQMVAGPRVPPDRGHRRTAGHDRRRRPARGLPRRDVRGRDCRPTPSRSATSPRPAGRPPPASCSAPTPTSTASRSPRT